MGGTESRFLGLLVEGNEEEALGLWHRFPELQHWLRYDVPLKSSPFRDKPLHCAARNTMKVLMLEFLERGADPHVRNANGETPLHLVCRSARCSSRTNARRAELLRLLLDSIVPESERFDCVNVNGSSSCESSDLRSASYPGFGGASSRERAAGAIGGIPDPYNLGVEDKNRNTPLHLAAASGLLSCVELLLAHSCPLFVFNIAGQSPCDVAGESKQLIIAKLLESKMVLTPQSTPSNHLSTSRVISRSRNRSFYNTDTLIKLRSDIIQQLSGTLKISEFSAQALLMAYGWSEDLVKEVWSQDRKEACQKAGLDLDNVKESDFENSVKSSPLLRDVTHTLAVQKVLPVTCEICFCDVTIPSEVVQVPCQHHFCVECWTSYLQTQIGQNQGKEIRCPGHACYMMVPIHLVAGHVPKSLYNKYASLNLKNFVDTYSEIKWCPYPNCESAVSLRMGINVECCHGHGFCWHCMKEPHEPCDCNLWQRWKDLATSEGELNSEVNKVSQEAAANARWIMSFTKPCPNCSSPIQKNEGCNHMTCRTCQYDFCWVCLDPWHLHNYKTGGYFSCNRFKQQEEADKGVRKAREKMVDNYTKAAKEAEERKLERFRHYYSRYSNHLNSLEIELKLLQNSQSKTKELAQFGKVLEKKVAATRKEVLMETPEEPAEATAHSMETNFLDDVIRVLLNARRILSASYCIGYFIPENTEQSHAHETLQGKLEEVVEMLAQMVNRPYLLTPQAKISETARNVDYLCEEYLTEMREVARAAAIHAKKVAAQRETERKTRQAAPSTQPRPPPAPRRYQHRIVDSIQLHRLHRVNLDALQIIEDL